MFKIFRDLRACFLVCVFAGAVSLGAVGCADGSGDDSAWPMTPPTGASGAQNNYPTFGNGNCKELDLKPFQSGYELDNGRPAQEAIRIYSGGDGTYAIPYTELSLQGTGLHATANYQEWANIYDGKTWTSREGANFAFTDSELDWFPKFVKTGAQWIIAATGFPTLESPQQVWVSGQDSSGNLTIPMGVTGMINGSFPGDQTFTNEDGKLAVATTYYATDSTNNLYITLSEQVNGKWLNEGPISVGGQPASGFVKALFYGKDHTPWLIYEKTNAFSEAQDSFNILHKSNGAWTDTVLVPVSEGIQVHSFSAAPMRTPTTDMLAMAWIGVPSKDFNSRVAFFDLTTGKMVGGATTVLFGSSGNSATMASVAVGPDGTRGFMAFYQPAVVDYTDPGNPLLNQNGRVWVTGFTGTMVASSHLVRPADFQNEAPQAFYSNCGTPSLAVSYTPAEFLDPNYNGKDTPPNYLQSIEIWQNLNVQYEIAQ